MKAKNIALWVIQVLLAAAMILHGVVFLFPSPAMREMMAQHPSPYSPAFMNFIFLMEALGGIGLILPAATRILPILTPLAALGLAIIMGGAVYTHLSTGQSATVGVPVVLLAMALIVAYGRWRAIPIAPRVRSVATV